ncbi:DUF3011 domain-containing protein [Marinicella sp. S1101]|uniref:DUF3011 domain-containing protein n=1 Tax=Marinicella marina TaxID=2996016 RepID=UPI002260A8A1|nr:DUF3011 domain-containing protein [Marinicella marina]MCX7554744.1 DUF3011 domain-containing protein [Marinicella marina]MDJ1141440.1 DUF3011 domain-containing protein [Marinicella marina]
MKKHLIWGLVLFSGLVFAADEEKKELAKLSTENNSTEEQFNTSKNSKSWGNTNYNRGDRFVCESNRGQRQHCRADTNGGVRLIRQIGYNSCQGNWGYDYYGVWVTNGCRGEFQIDRYQDYYGQEDDVVRCESYSYRRQTCATNLQGAEVQLIHQLSNRSCRGNWGFNRNEIWVANGCKADFLIMRNNYGSGSNYGNGVVECRSFGTNIEHCQVPELQSIELVEELGNSYRDSCRGNWGYSSHGIWVRNGCHARFQVVEYESRNDRPNYPNNQGREVVCESNYSQVRTCRADTSGRVEFVQQLSNTSCDQRWGYDTNGIWVKDGCRARFMTYPGNAGIVNQPPQRESFNIKCKSRKNKVKICDTDGPFRDVEFKREISKGKYPCEGNWGINRQGQLYVTNNCYAEFRIHK